MGFDTTKWFKQQYLKESLAKDLSDATPEGTGEVDFAKAVANVLKKDFGKQTYKAFMDALHTELSIEEYVNEVKDDFYPDSPEALRQATQMSRDILDKYKEKIKTIADKYEGQPGKSRQMMDELNDLLDADLKGIPFEDYVSNKVRATLGKALFRYYAQKNPELAKRM
jgi:mRNA-degrading endonuclease RelE of RelBE toxin-antitoxin system